LPNGNVLEQFEATPEFGNDKLGKADPFPSLHLRFSETT
jgi:hypothetical protein